MSVVLCNRVRGAEERLVGSRGLRHSTRDLQLHVGTAHDKGLVRCSHYKLWGRNLSKHPIGRHLYDTLLRGMLAQLRNHPAY